MPTPIRDQFQNEHVFARAVAFLIDELEGGGTVRPGSVGQTRWGISQREFSAGKIADLTRGEAESIYRRDYWNKVKGDLLPPALALLMLCAAVSITPRQAALIMQRVLRVSDDGTIGPETLIAAQGYRPQAELRAMFCELWLRYYYELARSKPFYQASLYGWGIRVFRVADEAGRWSA